MSKFGNYIQEAYDELIHKVTWPSWEELQQTTIIVLIALSLVTAVRFLVWISFLRTYCSLYIKLWVNKYGNDERS